MVTESLPWQARGVGRIVAQVKVNSITNGSAGIEFSGLVDTGAAYVTLPVAWKGRLGALEVLDVVNAELANQTTVRCEICGPVRIQIEGFRPVYSEVMFMDMQPDDGGVYEPLIGYIALEQSQAAVDLVGHRLVKVNKVDVK
jgi:hypothetical protein